MGNFNGLADKKGNAYGSDSRVETHKGGHAINGKGSYSTAEARLRLINAAKNK